MCLFGSNKQARHAFTFFELLVVLVILATALGMLAPNLRGFFFAHQTHEKALHLLALMRHARSQAVTQGITHRLVINIDDREYMLEQQVDGKYVPLGNSLGQTFDWPETMELTFEADTEQNSPIYLYFRPQGTVTPGRITLHGDDDDEKGYVLRSLTSSEPYALSTIKEDDDRNLD
ncbi:MAG: hypothetical protein CMJ19_02015 [Phycisphaeraceae bacterium]|nr:hypothetical protein [Phycisphaeraceae bacterium]